MEAGFRKLWSRKKSAGSSDQPSHRRDISSSNGISAKSQQTSFSAGRDGRPSIASSRLQSDRPYSRDKLGGSRDAVSRPSGDEYSRSKTGHRIQPMLVGISRPDTGVDRPNTAGSLQTAVLQAADTAENRPLDLPARLQAINVPDLKSKPSRHIDVFSAATTLPPPAARYNEEIAERNLDTFRLALENTPYIYDPSSKYQEEVAIRNAYLPYKTRASTDSRQRSMDHERTESMTNRSARNAMSPAPNGVNTYHNSTDSVGAVPKPSMDYTSYHVRQSSQRSRDAAYLSSIPQKGPSDSVVHNTVEPHLADQNPYPPARVAPAVNARDTRMQTITEGQTYKIAPLSVAKSPALSDAYTLNSSADQKTSAADHGLHPVNLSVPYRSGPNNRHSDPRSNNDVFFGPPSTGSTASSLRGRVVLPNRTIMDLTSDDPEIFSEASSTYQYSQYSPILEQAKSDAFQRIQPSQIHTEERHNSKTTESPTAVNNAARTRILNAAAASVAPFPQAETKLPFSSAFSPINTVASWSPRSSMYIAPATEPMSMTARVAAALEASKAIARENPMPVLSRPGNETPTVKERVASLESHTDTEGSTTPTSAEPSESIAQTKPVRISATPVKPVHEPVATEVVQTPSAKEEVKANVTPKIYTSPESINSSDFTNPSNTFGVRTRDFAIMPQKSATSLKKGPPAKPAAKVQPASNLGKAETRTKPVKTRTKQTTTSMPKSKDTGFDEEAFARKQADARAALERLQQSLNENFMSLPDRATVKNKVNNNKEAEGRAAASSVMLPSDAKATASGSSSQRPDLERPPPSSYRNSRGEQQQRSSLASSSRSLSTGSRSSRRAPAPSQLKNLEPASNPVDQKLLSPALLQALQMGKNPPRSPGEISLSSFPVPSSSRPPSQPDAPPGLHSHNSSVAGPMKRRNSSRSQTSNTSAFSIPYHMVPGRTSSMRDPVPEEGDVGYV